MGRVGVDDIEDLRGLRLDADARQELFAAATECTLSFLGAGGWPSGVVMSYLVHDGCFWLTAVRGRAHVEGVLRDPRVTLVISSAGTGLPRRMVAVAGTAQVHDDRTTLDRMLPLLAERLAPGRPEAFLKLLDSPRRVVIQVTPTRVTASHDSTKLPGDGRGGPARVPTDGQR